MSPIAKERERLTINQTENPPMELPQCLDAYKARAAKLYERTSLGQQLASCNLTDKRNTPLVVVQIFNTQGVLTATYHAPIAEVDMGRFILCPDGTAHRLTSDYSSGQEIQTVSAFSETNGDNGFNRSWPFYPNIDQSRQIIESQKGQIQTGTRNNINGISIRIDIRNRNKAGLGKKELATILQGSLESIDCLADGTPLP